MKEVCAIVNKRDKEKRERAAKMGHQEVLKSIEDDKILREFGNYTHLLPDDLKIYGKDKSYGTGPPVQKVDKSLVYKNVKLI